MNLNTFFNDAASWSGIAVPVLIAILIVVVGYLLSGLGQTLVRRWVPRAGGNSVTLAPLLGQAVRYSVLIVALVMAMSVLGIPTASVLTVIGHRGPRPCPRSPEHPLQRCGGNHAGLDSPDRGR